MWYLSPLRIEVNVGEEVSYKEWVINKRKECHEKQCWEFFWSLCWSIWLGKKNGSSTKRGRCPKAENCKSYWGKGEVQSCDG